MHYVLVSSEDTDLLGCDAASSGDNLKECTAFTHPLTEPHIPSPHTSTMLLMTELTMDWWPAAHQQGLEVGA